MTLYYQKGKITFIKIILNVFLLLVVTPTISSQEKVFIEPFVSFEYNDKVFSVDEIYSNSLTEEQTYTFKSENDDLFFLSISAKNLSLQLSDEDIENLTKIDFEAIQSLDNDTVSILHSNDFEINNFIGAIIIAKEITTEKQIAQYFMHKIEGKKLVTIMMQFQINKTKVDQLNHERINEVTSNVLVTKKNFGNNLEKEFQNSYSIEVEALPLRNLYHYSTNVDGVEIMQKTYDRDSLPHEVEPYPYHHTFRGKLLISPSLEHQVKYIKIKSVGSSYQIFEIQPEDELIFTCKDQQKGIIQRQGILIVIDESGKEVEIPFSLEYENN